VELVATSGIRSFTPYHVFQQGKVVGEAVLLYAGVTYHYIPFSAFFSRTDLEEAIAAVTKSIRWVGPALPAASSGKSI
jgi:hypothetical protein